jgi:hypothetical protein
MTPKQEVTTSEAVRIPRQCFGVCFDPLDLDARRRGRSPARLDIRRGQIRRDDGSAAERGANRHVAAAGSNVQNSLAATDVAGVDENRPKLPHCRSRKGVVVAERPHGLVGRLERVI